MRAAWLAATLAVPAAAGAQVADPARVTALTLRSRPAVGSDAHERFGASFAIGPAGLLTVFASGASSVRVSGYAAVASVRGYVWVAPWVALQVGAAASLAVRPDVSDDRVALQAVSGVGLVGGGVVFGRRQGGLRASLLGGLAWAWAPLDGATGSRKRDGADAGPGGGASVEISYQWPLGARGMAGLGATGWGAAGTDARDWLDPDNDPTSWTSFGGGLVATVSLR